MKIITVRLPEPLAAEIEVESRTRRISKAAVVRGRLRPRRGPAQRASAPLHAIADLIGLVDGLPANLSARRKRYLKATGLLEADAERVAKWRKAVEVAARESRAALRAFRPHSRMDR